MNDQQFMDYMREHHPYLLDIETMVRKVSDDTGFGEVAVSLKVHQGRVNKGEILPMVSKKYFQTKQY